MRDIMMKKLSASILLAIGAIPLAVSAYTLTVNVDGASTQYNVSTATVTSDVDGMLLTVTGLTAPAAAPASNVAPVIITSSLSVTEGSITVVPNILADDANGDGFTLALTGGADQESFNLTGSTLSFKTAPDYEAPGSAAGSNTYSVQVTATDDVSPPLSSVKTITVTVNNDPNDDSSGGGTPTPPSTSTCPTSLPSGVKIESGFPLNWAVSMGNTLISVPRGITKSIAIHTASSTLVAGKTTVVDASLTGDIRHMWISECPGGEIFTPEGYDSSTRLARGYGKKCEVSGSSKETIDWNQRANPTGVDLYSECVLVGNTNYYLNVKVDNCSRTDCVTRLNHSVD